MSRLPAVTAKEVMRVLERAGFFLVRSKGSHHRFVHGNDQTRQTTVSEHGGKSIPVGTLRAIINQAQLSVDEFVSLL